LICLPPEANAIPLAEPNGLINRQVFLLTTFTISNIGRLLPSLNGRIWKFSNWLCLAERSVLFHLYDQKLEGNRAGWYGPRNNLEFSNGVRYLYCNKWPSINRIFCPKPLPNICNEVPKRFYRKIPVYLTCDCRPDKWFCFSKH